MNEKKRALEVKLFRECIEDAIKATANMNCEYGQLDNYNPSDKDMRIIAMMFYTMRKVKK